MLGPPKLRCLDQPVAVSLEALVPASNFSRHLDAKLDLTFVRTWVQDCSAERGRPSIDPVVFFTLQLVLFFAGLRSERKLIETASLNLAHRWYLGYRLDEALPHHSSLTRIRERLGLSFFERFFAHVVELCQQAGLVWGEEVFFDGTKVRANADIDTLVPRWYANAKAHVGDLFNNDSPDAPADGSANGGSAEEPPSGGGVPDPTDTPAPELPVATTAGDPALVDPTRLPFGGTPEAERLLAATNDVAWKLLDRQRLDPNRPPSGSYQRITDRKVSTTDPDAAPMSTGGAAGLGYHDHYVVDGGTARVIMAALVTPADVQDNQAMVDLLDRARFRSHLHYATRVRVFAAPTTSCAACPLRERCTDSTKGRRLNRPFDQDARERARARQSSETYKKVLRKRAVWVEPLFGEAKDWHGLRRFRLRGLWKVNTEGLLIAAGQNLKRWLSRTGWGRRHGPCGSLALALPAIVVIGPRLR